MMLRLVASAVAGFVVCMAVTGLLQPTIYFSLFIGIPAGIAAAAAVFALATLRRAGTEKTEPKSR
jgi:hypothetical protein